MAINSKNANGEKTADKTYANISLNLTQQTKYNYTKSVKNFNVTSNINKQMYPSKSQFIRAPKHNPLANSLNVSLVTPSISLPKSLCPISRKKLRRTLSQLITEYNYHRFISDKTQIITYASTHGLSSVFENDIDSTLFNDYETEFDDGSYTNSSTSQSIVYLPEGCSFKDHNSTTNTVICSGKDMDFVPTFGILRDIDTLIFNDTSILVLDRKGAATLPRVTNLTFEKGVLMRVSFQDVMHYQNSIKKLSLVSNSISSLSFSNFYNNPANDTLEELDLRFNLISNLPQPPVRSETVLHKLKTIILSGNPLELIPGDFFYPLRASNVTSLYLNESGIMDYGAPTFEDERSPLAFLPRLEILDLSFNPELSIEKLKGLLSPYINGNIRVLNLDDNSYSEIPTAVLTVVQHSLMELSLVRSSFYCLDNTSFPYMPVLKVLHLQYSRISEIKAKTFDPLTALEVLNLDGNLLLTISDAVSLPSLKILTLDENPSEEISDDTPFRIMQNSFNSSQNLELLSFAKDHLEKIYSYYFKGLKDLSVLGLCECSISEIEDGSFSDLNKLEQLFLMKNRLQIITKNTFIGLYNLFHLDLSKNCINFYDAPSNKTDKEILNDEENENRILSVPFDVFSDLSNLRVLIMRNNKINFLSPLIFEKSRKLRLIDLNFNRITKWDEPLFRSNSQLNLLLLKNNEILTLTPAMIEDFNKTNLVVDLSGNIFTCSCSLLAFNNELNNTKFLGRSSYTCFNGTDYLTIDEYINSVNEPCDEYPLYRHIAWFIVLVGIVVICLTLVAVTYRNRWYLKYLAYKFKINVRPSIQNQGSEAYEYDTFVCYAQSDRKWIFEKLIRHLESAGSGLRVCVHERDFLVGEQITHNIIRSVEISRKVIVVISRAFVKSSWCMFELQMASNKILDEHKNKLILLLLESIPTSEQPKELRLLLRSRTYVSWVPGIEGERLFWARLVRAISKPTSNEKEITSESSDQPVQTQEAASTITPADDRDLKSELDFGEAADDEHVHKNSLDFVESINPYPPLQYLARLQMSDPQKLGYLNNSFENDAKNISKDMNKLKANNNIVNTQFTEIDNNLSVSTA